MHISKVLAAAIWIYSMVKYASFTPPENMFVGDSFHYLDLLAIPAMSILFGCMVRGYPFEMPSVTAGIDHLCGPGAYARFLVDVKPLLLFGVSGLVAGCSQLLLFFQQQGSATPFTTTVPFSAGVSFLIVRIILKKRGLLMEARDGAATSG